MASWKRLAVLEIYRLALENHIVITDKALLEYRSLCSHAPEAPDLPELVVEEVRSILLGLTVSHLSRRLQSDARHELLYVFKFPLYGVSAYLKAAIRTDCVVISLHEDR